MLSEAGEVQVERPLPRSGYTTSGPRGGERQNSICACESGALILHKAVLFQFLQGKSVPTLGPVPVRWRDPKGRSNAGKLLKLPLGAGIT